MIGQPAAQRGANQIGDTIDRAKQTLPLGALGGREDVTNAGGHQRDAHARAHALKRAERNELRHRGGGARQHRAKQEDSSADQQEPLAPKLV